MSEYNNEHKFNLSKETKNMYNLYLILGILFVGYTFTKISPSNDPMIFIAYIPGTIFLSICVYHLIQIHLLKPYIAIDPEVMIYFTGMRKIIIHFGDVESVKLKKYNETKTTRKVKLVIKSIGKLKKINIRHREFENADQIEGLIRSHINDESIF